MADPDPQSRRRRTARGRRGADALRRRARSAAARRPASSRVESTGRLPAVPSRTWSEPTCGNQAALDGRRLGRRRRRRGPSRSPCTPSPGWFCAGDGRPRADRRRRHQADARADPVIDLSIGGTEPMTGWYVASTTTRDGGDIVVRPVARDPAVPGVDRAVRREQPASASSDGRLLWAVMGTRGRDLGWHAGVSVSDPAGEHIEPPTIIAEADEPRLQRHRRHPARRRAVPGGRPRAPDPAERLVAFEPTRGAPGRRSEPTPFLGSNIKLFRLRSGRDRLRLPRRGPGACAA